jgi:hypothetical protein
MENKESDFVREQVRTRYAEIAKTNDSCGGGNRTNA